ncbi:DUF6339 family protein [Kitasatospora sp. YST-16]|uniref:DUF6339 family protein n=1 Tax=Kitasatospora sp. YST-16 TaxID=2998080 RepID=UPI0022850B50|nr:DUF6339 family protein [Kitasatospora sp. YST-16]WAL72571.1 DUF6339 family protein [Kitasatospora sp. YST-16]WNW38619.1 DUF6339 family protein [Streptomyces sp. Li-HN-5-13]
MKFEHATEGRIALLPVGVATRHLGRAVLSGAEPPAQVALLRAASVITDPSARWDTAPIRELLDQAMARFGSNRSGADAWLAPRLHATLRLTRGEAADKDLWAFLALVVAPDYVLWRHLPVRGENAPRTPVVQASRFVGGSSVQAFARLWWAAEMWRDGTDYRPVEAACTNQDFLNTALRLGIMDHRPTAQAVLRVVQNLAATGAPRLGDQLNALCKAVGIAGSTLMYEVIGPDELPDDAELLAWIDDADSAPPVPWDRLPDGPDDGAVPTVSVDTLTRLFEDVNAHLGRLRDRGSPSTPTGG